MTTPEVAHSVTHTHARGTLQKQLDGRAIWLYFLKGVPRPGVGQSQIQPLQCELSQQSFLPRRFPCVCLCASAAVTHACSAVAQWTACSVFQESSRRMDGHKAFSISRERINCSCPRVVLFASSQRSWRLSTFSLKIEDAVYCIVWPASPLATVL